MTEDPGGAVARGERARSGWRWARLGASVVAVCLLGCSGTAEEEPIPVRVVVVAMYEIGEDSGDRAGEFQLWKERQGLERRFAMPGEQHDLFMNTETGVLGMVTGVSHLEWFRRGDGSIAISEVGARPGGAQISKLISYAHDFDFYRAWARLMIDGTFDPPGREYAAGAAFLRGQGRGRVKAIHGLRRAQQEIGPLVVETDLPRLGQSPSSSYEGEGYVILRHHETRVVEKALHRLISLIRVELG